METNDYPKLILPDWFDDVSEYEAPYRGYLNYVEAELENGNRYKVYFIDPTRLRQNLESDVEAGRPYYAEPGMIVLPEVTVEKAKQALKHLLKDGFFDNLKPV